MGTFYRKENRRSDAVYDWQQGYRNGPGPHTAPSPYRRDSIRAEGNVSATNVNPVVFIDEGFPSVATRVTNRLHSRFANALGDSASFGATLTAELNQTVGMVGGTVLKLYNAAKQVKRLDFIGAAHTLGLPYSEKTVKKKVYFAAKGRNRRRYVVTRERYMKLPSGRLVQKTLANGWLFWSYGVQPLASDIYTGLKVLERPLDYKKRVFVTASSSESWTSYFGGPGTSYPLIVDKLSGSVRGACGASVSVSNPNLYLLNKLGLTNPVQWANEAIPFSFVLDWFSNLSQVIESITEYQGLTIESPYMSLHYQVSKFQSDNGAMVHNYDGHTFSRSTSLPTPTLVFEYERFQPQRALNAISLLVGFLPRK